MRHKETLTSTDNYFKLLPSSNWQCFQTLLIFIYLNSEYQWCHVNSLIIASTYTCHQPHSVSVFFFFLSNLWPDMNPFCLHLIFLSWSLVHALELSKWTFNSTQWFQLTKRLTKKKKQKKTRGPNQQDNKIIKTINHHRNWVIHINQILYIYIYIYINNFKRIVCR